MYFWIQTERVLLNSRPAGPARRILVLIKVSMQSMSLNLVMVEKDLFSAKEQFIAQQTKSYMEIMGSSAALLNACFQSPDGRLGIEISTTGIKQFLFAGNTWP